MIKTVVNAMWHIDEKYQLVKTSNDQPINLEEEPVFIIRGRDNLAVRALLAYREIAEINGCNDYLLDGVDDSIYKFKCFANDHPGRMKQPGVTRVSDPDVS